MVKKMLFWRPNYYKVKVIASTSGSRYTWNDRHGNNRIYSKLDWAFVNNEWLDTIPMIKVQFLWEGISDHCP